MSVEFSFFVSCRSKEEGLCEGIWFTFSTKGQQTKNQQQREDRKFEAKGRGSRQSCVFVCDGLQRMAKKTSVSFSGLQRGSLNIPHRQGEEEGKLINIRTESSANRQQGEGMSGLRRNWEGVRLPYAFFPPPFAGEGGRERAQDGCRESKRVQEREVYGTVSFLPSDITEFGVCV